MARRKGEFWNGGIRAGYDYDRVRLVREPYQRAELLDMLRALAKRAPNTTLADLHDLTAAEALKREFGSVENACRAAGLDDWPVRRLEPLMPADEVLAAIHERLRAKSSLSSWDVELDDRHLHKSGVRQFGAWHVALAAAELPAAALEEALGDRRRWTKTSVLDALRARRREGKSMSPSDVREEDSGLFQAARSYLGYDADVAIRDWGAPRLRVHWTKKKVVEALRENHARQDKLPSSVTAAVLQLFGSMEAARKAARVPVLRTFWSDQGVIDEIRSLSGTKASTNLVAIAQRRFGSWRAALAAAGVPSKKRQWDVSSIAEALAARVADGRPLDPATLRREDSSLYYAIKHRFADVALALREVERTGGLPSMDSAEDHQGRPRGG